MNYSGRDVDTLALAVKAGDRAAFDELALRLQARVYGLAYKFAGNREDALDIAQDAFVKAFVKIESWRPGNGFLPWLMRITSNQAIDHLRRVKRRKTGSLDDAFAGGEANIRDRGPNSGPDSRAWSKEIDSRIRLAMKKLSKSQCEVFVLRHYEGLRLSEIAAARGCTTGSVKVHLFRAIRKLRHELDDLI